MVDDMIVTCYRPNPAVRKRDIRGGREKAWIKRKRRSPGAPGTGPYAALATSARVTPCWRQGEQPLDPAQRHIAFGIPNVVRLSVGGSLCGRSGMVRSPPGNADVHPYQKDGTILFSMRGPLSYSCPMETIRIGYARCSTDRQDLTAQRCALVDLGVDPERILPPITASPAARAPAPVSTRPLQPCAPATRSS